MAVRSDDSLWSWGSNDYGQPGHGPAGSSAVPIHSQLYFVLSGDLRDHPTRKHPGARVPGQSPPQLRRAAPQHPRRPGGARWVLGHLPV
ncbi:hypothetical protein ACN28E_39735 [Archangium lansingense]|uniref:hypothetical protein n=1 Tax=Archangium lansingense TaxID=2995310 RepID=UPI003B8135A3